MKRLICLCLCCLLLWGCSAEPIETTVTENAIHLDPMMLGDLSVTIVDGHVTEGAEDMATFALYTDYLDLPTEGSDPCRITIHRIYDGTEYISVLSYADGLYTLDDGETRRQYPYLIYSCENLRPQATSDFAEYYLLSEDPTMTSQRYHQHLLSAVLQTDFPATTIVYTDFLSFERAERYGTVPAKYLTHPDLLAVARFCRDGFYVEQLLEEPDPAASGLTETVRKCFDYDFKPLPDDSLPESTACGYYRGEAIGCDDTLFDPKPEDRLPEGSYPVLQNLGIWQEGEGYVLLRCHRMEGWKLEGLVPVYSSREYINGFHALFYSELILTYYDQNGIPQWQTTGEIFVR